MAGYFQDSPRNTNVEGRFFFFCKYRRGMERTTQSTSVPRKSNFNVCLYIFMSRAEEVWRKKRPREGEVFCLTKGSIVTVLQIEWLMNEK